MHYAAEKKDNMLFVFEGIRHILAIALVAALMIYVIF